MQCLSLAVGQFVHRVVARAAQTVEEVALGSSDRIPVRQCIDHSTQVLFRIEEDADLGSGALRKHLAELPKLVERYVRLSRELLLRLGAERDQTWVVMGEGVWFT